MNKAYLFLVILFSINIVTIGLGLSTFSNTEYMNITGQSEEELMEALNPTEPVQDSLPAEGSSISEQANQGSRLGWAEGYQGYVTTKELLRNLMFGYQNIFILIGLSPLLVILFTGIIGIIQIGLLFYIALQIISVIRGLFFG